MKINHGEHGGHGAVSLGDGLRDGKCCGEKALVELDEQTEANIGNAPRWHTLEYSRSKDARSKDARSKDGCTALPSPCAPCPPVDFIQLESGSTGKGCLPQLLPVIVHGNKALLGKLASLAPES